jgi:SAM-dependent methyltransferase
MPFWSKQAEARKPPIPPDHLLLGVGPGDYCKVGEYALGVLEKVARLRGSDRILDIGCGPGRIAWPLSAKLGRRGSYDGLDVVKAYVDWCNESLGLDPAQFRFHHADIRTTFYNPDGAIEAEDFVFPWRGGSFDLVIATSLFTHLLPAGTEHYAREIARVLAPKGRLFATFFILDEAGKEAAAGGKTYPTFLHEMEHGRLHDPAIPESAVAFELEWLLPALESAGLTVAAVHPGHWKGRPGFEYQDLVLARKSR